MWDSSRGRKLEFEWEPLFIESWFGCHLRRASGLDGVIGLDCGAGPTAGCCPRPVMGWGSPRRDSAREDCRVARRAKIRQEARAVSGHLHVCDDGPLINERHFPEAFTRHHLRSAGGPQCLYHVRQSGFHLLGRHGADWDGRWNRGIRWIGSPWLRRRRGDCVGRSRRAAGTAEPWAFLSGESCHPPG